MSRIGMCLVLGALMQGCGWERTMIFPSPSRSAAIEIWQAPRVIGGKARVELVTAKRRTVLYTQPREAFVRFVHVYWSRDEGIVGIFVLNGTLAADVRTGELRSFELIRNDFAKSLRDTYNVPPQEDPIMWAARSDAQFAFSKLHPEIRLH